MLKKYIKIFRVSGIIFLCFFFWDLYIAARNLQHSIAESKIKFIQVTSNRQLCSKCENLIQKINVQIFSIPSSNAEQLMVELEKEKCMSDFSGYAMGYNLGTIYQEGIGIEKNITKAANYYKKKVRLGGILNQCVSLGLYTQTKNFLKKTMKRLFIGLHWLESMVIIFHCVDLGKFILMKVVCILILKGLLIL